MRAALTHGLRDTVSRRLFRLTGAEPGEVVLGQRRVFILPTRAGLGFALLLVLLFIGAVNYNLAMGLALTFFLASAALVAMHLTFRNLAYLHLAPGRASPVHAGEEARFELHLSNRRRHARYAVWVGFTGEGVPRREQPLRHRRRRRLPGDAAGAGSAPRLAGRAAHQAAYHLPAGPAAGLELLASGAEGAGVSASRGTRAAAAQRWMRCRATTMARADRTISPGCAPTRRAIR